MTDTSTNVREHYSATNLTSRINAALATLGPEGQMLTVAQLAPLDQFHTRGHPRDHRTGNRSWARALDARARSRLRHRRPGTLSGRYIRM